MTLLPQKKSVVYFFCSIACSFICSIICPTSQSLFLKAEAREIQLNCGAEPRVHTTRAEPSAQIRFDDSKSSLGVPTTISIDWHQPDRTSRFSGFAVEKKVRWSGLLVRSIEFSVGPKIGFELLFSPADDIYMMRRKVAGQRYTELSCRIE